VVFDYASGEGGPELLAEAAAQLVRRRADVIACYGTAASYAAKQAATTIPIVMISSRGVAYHVANKESLVIPAKCAAGGRDWVMRCPTERARGCPCHPDSGATAIRGGGCSQQPHAPSPPVFPFFALLPLAVPVGTMRHHALALLLDRLVARVDLLSGHPDWPSRRAAW
jgi:hypothetical protein